VESVAKKRNWEIVKVWKWDFWLEWLLENWTAGRREWVIKNWKSGEIPNCHQKVIHWVEIGIKKRPVSSPIVDSYKN
jgi:hypothetical protein